MRVTTLPNSMPSWDTWWLVRPKRFSVRFAMCEWRNRCYNDSYIMACISNYALIVDVLAPVLMRIASPLVVDSLLAFDALPGRRSCPVAHASRVSVSASRRDSLFREVRDDETSSPTRETRA